MKTRLLGGGGQLQLYLCGGWLWVCCGSWIRGMGSRGVLLGVLPACDCLGNLSIGQVCLAINAVGCLGAAQIIKSARVAGASLVVVFLFFFCFFLGVMVFSE